MKLNEIDPQAWLADTLSKNRRDAADPAANSYLGTCPTAAAHRRVTAALGGRVTIRQKLQVEDQKHRACHRDQYSQRQHGHSSWIRGGENSEPAKQEHGPTDHTDYKRPKRLGSIAAKTSIAGSAPWVRELAALHPQAVPSALVSLDQAGIKDV